MKKITYILMLLTSLFVMIGCVNETTLNEIKLNIDFESLDVITESDDFDASITFDAYYEVTITLNNKVSFSSELKLYINDLLIDEDEYELRDDMVIYRFYELSEIHLDIDVDQEEIITESNQFTSTMTKNNDYEITITLNEYISFSSEFTLYINNLKIDKDAYSINEHRITYLVSDLEDINPNRYVEVDATFNLNGGMLTKADFEDVDPDESLMITTKNDGSGDSLTLIDDQKLALRYFHKIFIKYQESFDAYEVVFVDDVTNSVENLDVDDYDYIIALDQYYENDQVLTAIRNYTTNDKTLSFVIFDQDLSTYESGDLNAHFYTADIVGVSFHKTYLSEEPLPTPVRDEYRFIGWFNGEEEVFNYPGYQLKDGITSITYEARWEGYTMNELENYLHELIPDEVYNDLLLPTTYSGFTLDWKTSNEGVITSSGQFIRPYTTETITLTVDITSSLDTVTRTYDVVVIGYKSLDKPIASSYIYRDYDQVDEAFFETLDIINTAFILGNAAGDLYGTAYLNQVETYIMPEARKHGNWVIMSVGPSTEWSTIASSSEGIENFANQIVLFINTYGFDGVDIDWETPTSAETKRYTALMKVVYEKVKENNPNHLVTTAITGGMWQPEKYDLIYSNQYLDYINLMTYGMTSNAGQYQNPLYRSLSYHNPSALVGRSLSTASIDESVKIFKNDYQVAYEKIIVGLAFYGIKQTRTYDSISNTYSSWTNDGSVYYHDIYNVYLNHEEYTEYYDLNAGVPYLLNDDKTVFISYDSPRSILEKSKYIIDENIGGLMFWEYGTDTSGILLQAMRTGLEK